MTHDEAARLVAVMLAAVPSHRVDAKSIPGMIAAYRDLLDDLSYEQCNAALRVLLQTRTWLPSVADIRSTALEITRGPVRAGGEAWGSVLRAISAEGVYRQPGVDFVFADPVTAQCVAAFGWQNLCSSENPTADRARFVELYDKLATQHRREQQSPALAAAAEVRELGRGQVDALVSSITKRLTGDPS
jgi:hypothetical protein